MNSGDDDLSARDPLIQDGGDEVDHEGLDGNSDTEPLVRITLSNAGRIVWLLTLSAGISGLLFGYDTGIISSTLVTVGSDLDGRPLSTTSKTAITAVTSLFALLFAPITGFLADAYGRRSVILVASVLFIVGAVIQALAGHVSVMVGGRAIVGAGIGLASSATPLYITELAPADIRGRLVTVQSLFITGGQVVAYCLGWLLARFPAGWRWMVGLGAMPALIQLFLLTLMPESPRWLVKTGRHDRARIVLQRIYGGLDDKDQQLVVESVLNGIDSEVTQERKLRLVPENSRTPTAAHAGSLIAAKQLVFVAQHRRALTIACLLQIFQQACGFNSLMYFSATIFSLVGFASPIGTSLSVALTNFLFTIAAFTYIDTVGRRKILLRSIPLMTVGLLLCSLAFYFIHAIESSDSPAAGHIKAGPGAAPWPLLLLISMILYVAAYAIGLGCVPWQQSELFPMAVRALGSGIATATNWTSNFLVASTFLPMMDVLGASFTFLIYAAICILGWICVWRIYPETAGLELEEVGEVLKDSFGVQKSVEVFQARKARS